jgi:hypothetical protein
VIYHRGKLSDSERELIRPLEQQQDKSLANVTVETVDLADESDKSEAKTADRALYDALGKPTLPWLVVHYPAHLRISKPAWAAPLNQDVVTAAVGSPIRAELARRLADGQTAVWLFLESGQPEKDDPAVALIETRLADLENNLKLPELTDSPDDALVTTLPLEIKFSVLRVPRNVSAEHALVAMLLGSEPDLAERSDPIVFPVFGRGRALLPLIGPGITPQNIHEAASFLTGPCSCEVKEQNPGFDLMLSADWDSLLLEQGIALTATQTRTPDKNAEPVLVPIPSGKPALTSSTAPSGTDPSSATALPTPAENLQSAVTGTISTRQTWMIAGAILGGVILLAIVVAIGQSRTAS